MPVELDDQNYYSADYTDTVASLINLRLAENGLILRFRHSLSNIISIIISYNLAVIVE